MARKPKPIPLPAEVWVMAWHSSTLHGTFSHVAAGDKFFATREECQHSIDTMQPWIGMGSCSQYRPINLVNANGTT